MIPAGTVKVAGRLVLEVNPEAWADTFDEPYSPRVLEEYLVEVLEQCRAAQGGALAEIRAVQVRSH